MSLVRTVTHWHQADQIAQITKPEGTVLEIGPGCGHTTWMLRDWGFNVTTFDHDESIHPDIVGDIASIPTDSDSFDCVMAAEVLEHLPFEEFGPVLSELRRVSSDKVIITLPAPFVGLSALLNFTKSPTGGFHFGLPYWVKHATGRSHYWELGKRGYSIRKIRNIIRDRGFRVIREFRPKPSLYCYFYVLSIDP